MIEICDDDLNSHSTHMYECEEIHANVHAPNIGSRAIVQRWKDNWVKCRDEANIDFTNCGANGPGKFIYGLDGETEYDKNSRGI